VTDSLADLPQPEFDGTLDPDSLETDGDNPNEMTDEQFGLLCERMRQNGWLGGPIITNTDGLIADGQHRWQAAQEIGLSEVPVKQFDIDDATRRLWRQELNKIHGEHDSKRDALEYDYLLDSGKSDEVHTLVNAADEDLDELLAQIKMDTSLPATYEYDTDHSVYFEDCVEGMKKRLEDDSVDMVFTSPPYNVDLSNSRDQSDKDREFYSDDLSNSEYRQFLGDVFSELARVTKTSGHILLNMPLGLAPDAESPFRWLPDLATDPFSWDERTIVWYKGNVLTNGGLNSNDSGRLANVWEPIFHFTAEPQPLDVGPTERFDVWEVSPSNYDSENYGDHPAPYPIELVGKALETFTTEGDTILDPFIGSGTTAVAAIQNQRNYTGFELDEDGQYKPIIERRIGEAKRQVAANEQ